MSGPLLIDDQGSLRRSLTSTPLYNTHIQWISPYIGDTKCIKCITFCVRILSETVPVSSFRRRRESNPLNRL